MKRPWLILLIVLLGFTGCTITRHYTNARGESCEKRYKFYLIFVKMNYDCGPKNVPIKAPAAGLNGSLPLETTPKTK